MIEKNQKQYGLIDRIGSWAGSLLKIAVLAALALYGYTWWQEHPEASRAAVLKLNRLGDQVFGKATLKRDVRVPLSVVIKRPGIDEGLDGVRIGEAVLPAGKEVRLLNPMAPQSEPGKVEIVTEVIAVVDRSDLESAFEKAEAAAPPGK